MSTNYEAICLKLAPQLLTFLARNWNSCHRERLHKFSFSLCHVRS